MRRIKQTAEEQLELQRRHRRRVSAAADSLGCPNMNDTKWREVFGVLNRHHAGPLSIKFVNEPAPRKVDTFYPATPSWTESNIGAFQHRDVEWLELTEEVWRNAEAELRTLGKLPLAMNGEVVRIQAYGPLTRIDHAGKARH